MQKRKGKTAWMASLETREKQRGKRHTFKDGRELTKELSYRSQEESNMFLNGLDMVRACKWNFIKAQVLKGTGWRSGTHCPSAAERRRLAGHELTWATQPRTTVMRTS